MIRLPSFDSPSWSGAAYLAPAVFAPLRQPGPPPLSHRLRLPHRWPRPLRNLDHLHFTRAFLNARFETLSATAPHTRAGRSASRRSLDHLAPTSSGARCARAVPATSRVRACALRAFRAFPLVCQIMGVYTLVAWIGA